MLRGAFCLIGMVFFLTCAIGALFGPEKDDTETRRVGLFYLGMSAWAAVALLT